MRRIQEGFEEWICLKKLVLGNCKALEEFLSGVCTLKALEDLSFNRCKLLRTISEGLGVEFFEEIVHVGLRGPGGVPFWNMHSQGFGGFTVQWIQIFKECTRRDKGWGFDLFEEIIHVG